MLDLCASGQSDVTSAERRGVFGDLRLWRFLQSREEEIQCGWCVVSSFASLSLSLSLSLTLSQLEFWSADYPLPSFDLAPLSRNLSFIAFLSADRIKLGFLCFLQRRSRIGRKITFNYFNFFGTNFIEISLCADLMRRSPFFPFWRKSQHQ